MNEVEIKDTLATFKESQDATLYTLQAWLRNGAEAALVRLVDVRARECELLAVILNGIQENRGPGFEKGHGSFKRKRVMPNGDASEYR